MDLALDLVERADPFERLLGDRRAITLGGIIEAAADMRPAVGEHSRPAGAIGFAELAIGLIAIDLQDAAIIAEKLRGPHATPARHVSIGDRRWIGTAMRAIIADHRPEIAGLGLASARRQHLGGGLIDEQSGAG